MKKETEREANKICNSSIIGLLIVMFMVTAFLVPNRNAVLDDADRHNTQSLTASLRDAGCKNPGIVIAEMDKRYLRVEYSKDLYISLLVAIGFTLFISLVNALFSQAGIEFSPGKKEPA